MTTQRQQELAESRVGRIVLHLLAMWADHEVEFHLQGIERELLLK